MYVYPQDGVLCLTFHSSYDPLPSQKGTFINSQDVFSVVHNVHLEVGVNAFARFGHRTIVFYLCRMSSIPSSVLLHFRK